MQLEPTPVTNILIVDDQLLMRRSIIRLLDREHFQTHAVGDYAGAIEALEHQTFDLAIIDVVLPGMGGPELAGVLRQTLPGMAVLFMSGYDQGTAAKQGVGSADYFLQKPFSRAALLDCMERALEA